MGLNRDLNPGPPAPKAGIIPLDHLATLIYHSWVGDLKQLDHQCRPKKVIWQRWDSNPRPRKDWCLKPAP